MGMLMQDVLESFSKCFGATDTLIECKSKGCKKSLAPHKFGVNVGGNNVIGRQLRKDNSFNNRDRTRDPSPRSSNNDKESQQEGRNTNSKVISSKMKMMQERKRNARKNNRTSPSSSSEEPKQQTLAKNREISQIFRMRNSSSAAKSSDKVPGRTSTQETDEDSACIPSKSPPMPLFNRFNVVNVATAKDEGSPKNSLIVFLASGSHRSINNANCSKPFESRLQHTRRRLTGNNYASIPLTIEVF